MANVLYDALFAPCRNSGAPFLRGPDDGTMGADEFHASVVRTAAAISSLGLIAGDRLALQVEKSPEALSVYGACLMLGVVFLPLNTAYTPQEIAYFVSDAEPGALICDPSAADALSRTLPDIHLLTLDASGGGTFGDLVADLGPDAKVAPRAEGDLAALLYTSGTTGRSKGAMLTHGNLASNARALCELWRITGDDVLLHALPIFHAHGLFVAVNTTLMAGASMIFLPRFDADAVIAALPDATTMMGVPTFYTRLLDDPRFDRELAAHMRLFVSGSAPLLAETHRRFEDRTGHRVLERYGMTETGMNASNPYDGERRAGTVGFPLPDVEIRVADDTGQYLPAGETGMVEVRGPNVFRGYWRMPEKTEEDLRANGWLITGDLGMIDADGYLHIVGRSKDLVISGGYNVYPKEVEMVLDAAPWVRESAVFGVPHDDFGEAVVAVIVPMPDAERDLDGLRDEIAGSLAKYKHPKKLIVSDALPRNTMGKVQKTELRRTHGALFSTQ